MMITNRISHHGHVPSFPDGKRSDPNPPYESVRPSLPNHRYYAAAVVGITPTRPRRGRSAAATPPQSYSTFWRRQLKGERGRGMGEKGRDEKQTEKDPSVMDLNANAKRSRNLPQFENRSIGNSFVERRRPLRHLNVKL